MQHYEIKQELERKYTSALSDLYSEFERGEISAVTFKRAFEAIYTTVSGLVEYESLNDIASDIREIN